MAILPPGTISPAIGCTRWRASDGCLLQDPGKRPSGAVACEIAGSLPATGKRRFARLVCAEAEGGPVVIDGNLAVWAKAVLTDNWPEGVAIQICAIAFGVGDPE